MAPLLYSPPGAGLPPPGPAGPSPPGQPAPGHGSGAVRGRAVRPPRRSTARPHRPPAARPAAAAAADLDRTGDTAEHGRLSAVFPIGWAHRYTSSRIGRSWKIQPRVGSCVTSRGEQRHKTRVDELLMRDISRKLVCKLDHCVTYSVFAQSRRRSPPRAADITKTNGARDCGGRHIQAP